MSCGLARERRNRVYGHMGTIPGLRPLPALPLHRAYPPSREETKPFKRRHRGRMAVGSSTRVPGAGTQVTLIVVPTPPSVKTKVLGICRLQFRAAPPLLVLSGWLFRTAVAWSSASLLRSGVGPCMAVEV